MRAQQLEGIGRIGFGAWQIGDDSCGPVDEASAMHALSAAADAGANTALDCRAFADGETSPHFLSADTACVAARRDVAP